MSDSKVVLTYGPSGVGKTTDQGYSFPRALFAAAPGALNSIESVCGYMPATTQVDTIEEATKLIKDVSGKFDWLVIDDFSFMAEQTFSRLEKKLSGFKLWGKLRDVALGTHREAVGSRSGDLLALAETCYERYLGLFPEAEGAYEVRFWYAEALFSLKKYDRAADEYEAVVAADPGGRYLRDAAAGSIYAIERHMEALGVGR